MTTYTAVQITEGNCGNDMIPIVIVPREMLMESWVNHIWRSGWRTEIVYFHILIPHGVPLWSIPRSIHTLKTHRVVTMPTVSSLVALQVVISTIYGAASEGKVVRVTTLGFQYLENRAQCTRDISCLFQSVHKRHPICECLQVYTQNATRHSGQTCFLIKPIDFIEAYGCS